MAKDKIKLHNIEPELLFITASSKDQRGRRVLVKYDNVENTIYPETLRDRAILPLIGIDSKEKLELIQSFFK